MSEQASGQTNFQGPIRSRGNSLRLARWAEFKGIDNIHRSEELPLDYQVKARNVYINDKGKYVSRPGRTLVLSGNIHSLFPFGNYLFGVRNDTLVAIDRNYEVTPLRVVGSGKMSFTVIGTWLAFTNSSVIGYIKDLVAYDFSDVTLQNKIKVFPSLIVRTYRSRMYLAKDNILWFTDAGNYGRIDTRKGFVMFPEDINMVEPIDDGIFVGSDKVYFLRGPSPEKFQQEVADSDRAIYGTSAVFDAIKIGSEVSGKIAIWTSEVGVCMGLPGGFAQSSVKVTNTVEGTYQVPTCREGAGFINTVDGLYYVATLRR